ncbi:MAG: hypothetical protein AB1644_08235 [Candidatus Zixiibacteriota bacterium]
MSWQRTLSSFCLLFSLVMVFASDGRAQGRSVSSSIQVSASVIRPLGILNGGPTVSATGAPPGMILLQPRPGGLCLTLSVDNNSPREVTPLPDLGAEEGDLAAVYSLAAALQSAAGPDATIVMTLIGTEN